MSNRIDPIEGGLPRNREGFEEAPRASRRVPTGLGRRGGGSEHSRMEGRGRARGRGRSGGGGGEGNGLALAVVADVPRAEGQPEL
eukprot:4877607-Pyramimonas_sp.AAC.1